MSDGVALEDSKMQAGAAAAAVAAVAASSEAVIAAAAESHWLGAFVNPSTLLILLCCAAVIAATTLLAVLPSSRGAHGDSSSSGNDGFLSLLLSPRVGLRRKLQHATSGLLILFLYLRSGLSSSQASFCLLSSAAGLFAIHLLRSRVPAVQRVYLTLFRPLMRPHELHGPPGALFFLLGCGMTIELFGSDSVTARLLGLSPVSVGCATAEGANPWSIAVATGGLADIPALAILCLSVGDPLASLVGQMLGARDRWRLSLAAGGDKSLIAAAISSAVCAFASHSLLHLMLHAATASTVAASASPLLLTACSAPELMSWSGSECAAQLAASERGVWCWSLLAGLAAAVFELWPLGLFLPGSAAAPVSVDDNLRIPVLTGLVLWTARAMGLLPPTLLVEAHCR